MAPERSPSAIIADHMKKIPVDLEGMIRQLGLKLAMDPALPSSIAGKLIKDPSAPSGYRIIVNANDNPRRRRFTMAHEVAHFILHRDLLGEDVVDDALYRSAALSDEYERQADRFAAQILLPAEMVRDAYKSLKVLSLLAQLFDVSDAALRIRLSGLGLAGVR